MTKQTTTAKDLWYKDVWYFFDHADQILSNPRLAKTPIRVDRYGIIHDATLGAYVAWWKSGEGQLTDPTDGEPVIISSFSGNPMTGSNICTCIKRDGTQIHLCHPHFLSLLHSLSSWTSHPS